MARTIAKNYDEKRGLILDRAARLFADEGFDRASVNSVAQACDISKANIYHYYKSKDEILFDILDKYLSALQARI
ncbi:MAG: helix-turn-helix domain-containing protein [Pseudomonadota bacterium]